MEASMKKVRLISAILLFNGCYHYLPDAGEYRTLSSERAVRFRSAPRMEILSAPTLKDQQDLHGRGRDRNTLERRIERLERRMDELIELAGALTRPQSPNDDEATKERDIFQLLDEGKQAFLEGDYETAISKFEQVMRLKRNQEEALKLGERAEIEFLVEVMSKEGKFKNFAEFLTQDPRLASKVKWSPELIEEILNDLKSSDERRSQWAMQRLLFEVGEPAVPALTKLLGDPREKLRESVIIILSQMGSDVMSGVIACLSSENEHMRRSAMIVLGNRGDKQAVPHLLSIYKNHKEPSEMRDLAGAAIRRITGKAPE